MSPKQKVTNVPALWIMVVGLSAAIVVPTTSSGVAYAQSNADKQSALKAYEKGTIQYNLGKWEEAIEFFEIAFETFPDAAFLFNIAQSHRQADNCQKAIFFYGRYLALKPDASNVDEVEGFIAELEAKCKTASGAVKPAAGDNSASRPGEKSTASIASPMAKGVVKPTQDSVGVLRVHASMGSSVLFAGAELDTPPQLSLTLGAGYPIDLGSVVLDVGVLTSYSPIAWTTADTSGTISLIGALANLGVSKALASKVSVRGEIGAGLLLISGLGEQGNVFTEDGMTGDDLALAASFRLALGAELAVSEMLAITVQPAIFTFSPAPSGLRSSIDSLSTYQALLGLGLKL